MLDLDSDGCITKHDWSRFVNTIEFNLKNLSIHNPTLQSLLNIPLFKPESDRKQTSPLDVIYFEQF